MINFDANVKKTTARHQCENRCTVFWCSPLGVMLNLTSARQNVGVWMKKNLSAWKPLITPQTPLKSLCAYWQRASRPITRKIWGLPWLLVGKSNRAKVCFHRKRSWYCLENFLQNKISVAGFILIEFVVEVCIASPSWSELCWVSTVLSGADSGQNLSPSDLQKQNHWVWGEVVWLRKSRSVFSIRESCVPLLSINSCAPPPPICLDQPNPQSNQADLSACEPVPVYGPTSDSNLKRKKRTTPESWQRGYTIRGFHVGAAINFFDANSNFFDVDSGFVFTLRVLMTSTTSTAKVKTTLNFCTWSFNVCFHDTVSTFYWQHQRMVHTIHNCNFTFDAISTFSWQHQRWSCGWEKWCCQHPTWKMLYKACQLRNRFSSGITTGLLTWSPKLHRHKTKNTSAYKQIVKCFRICFHSSFQVQNWLVFLVWLLTVNG